MNTFNIRKLSSLRGSTEDGWVHFPQRSDLSLTFIKINSNQIKLKVMWRATILEQIEFSPCSQLSYQSASLQVTTRYPYLAFKWLDGNTISKKFQVGFNDTIEYERCVAHINLLGITIKYLGDSRQYSQHYDQNSQFLSQFPPSQTIHSQVQSQIKHQSHIQVQLPEHSQAIYSQYSQQSPINLTQEYNFSIPVDNDTTLVEFTELNNKDDNHSSSPNIYSMSDEDIKQIIKQKLKNPEFVKFVERLDELLK